jgi:predicted Zn-dependent peptidase
MLNRQIAPAFNRNFSFQLIAPEQIKLPNGTDLILLNGGGQNVIKVEVIFPSGRWYEKNWGESYFTTQLLTKGTKSKNSFEIASIFDQLGAHFEISAGLDFVSLTLFSLTRNLSASLDLLIEILNEPVFDEKEIQQVKSIYLQNLKVNQEKTSFLASRLFRKVLFGDDHPYGKELEEGEIGKITRDQLIRFYQSAFGQFKVVVSGKIDPYNRDRIFNALSPLTNNQIGEKRHQASPSSTQQHHADKANSLQSSLRVGKRTIGRKDPDYAYLIFLNHILGGYFGSRLMKNIREEKGLTYGIYSSIHAMRHDSYMVIGTDVNNENSELAFSEIIKEIDRLCDQQVGDEELETARYHFIGSLQAELSTAFAHAEKIKAIILYDLEADHYHSMLKKINNATAADLRAMANKYFGGTKFYKVSAG